MSATMSPSALKPFGIKRVCTVWNISRSTIHRHKVLELHGATPKKKREPKTCLADAQLFEEIKIVLRNSPFVSEGYRKVWARLRQQSSLFSAPRRILRIMRKVTCSLRLGADHRQDLARTTEQLSRNDQMRCGQSTVLRA